MIILNNDIPTSYPRSHSCLNSIRLFSPSTLPYSFFSSDSTSISSYSQRKPKRISKLQKAALSQQLRENPKFCSILTGHLLGDGSISIHGKDGLFRLCSKDYAFVQFVWDYFHSLGLVGTEPYRSDSRDKRNGNTYTSYQFASLTLPYFTQLYYQWYTKVNGKPLRSSLLTSMSISLILLLPIGYLEMGITRE